MFYKVCIFSCVVLSDILAMEKTLDEQTQRFQSLSKRFEYYKLPAPVRHAKNKNEMFFGKISLYNSIINIKDLGYDYYQDRSAISNHLLADVVKRNETAQQKGKVRAIEDSPFIARLIANNYRIFLTPQERFNGRFFDLLIDLIKDNAVVFEEDMQQPIRVRDIIFNIIVRIDNSLGEVLKTPRFTILINNCFADISEQSEHDYKKTKEYTEKLLIFLIKNINLEIGVIQGSKNHLINAHQIKEWLWVRQGSPTIDRKTYADANYNYAFLKSNFTDLKSNFTKTEEDYAINAETICKQADNELEKIKLENEQYINSIKSMLSEHKFVSYPDERKGIVFFSEEKETKKILFGNAFYYLKRQSKSVFRGCFGYIANKNQPKGQRLPELSKEEGQNIKTILVNGYQIYLMPAEENKSAILEELIALSGEDPVILTYNNREIKFNDIIFNIEMSVKTTKYDQSPTFILRISNIDNKDDINSIVEMAKEHDVFRTKKYTEALLVYLYNRFKQKNCLGFSGKIPAESAQIKDLFFVSQGSPESLSGRVPDLFDDRNNFAFFLSDITGKEENYIIDPAILSNPLIQEAFDRIGRGLKEGLQLDSGQHKIENQSIILEPDASQSNSKKQSKDDESAESNESRSTQSSWFGTAVNFIFNIPTNIAHGLSRLAGYLFPGYRFQKD